jgi:hypothetical protein
VAGLVFREKDEAAQAVLDLVLVDGWARTGRWAGPVLPSSGAPVRWAWAAWVPKALQASLTALPEAPVLLSLPVGSIPAAEWQAWEQWAGALPVWISSGSVPKECQARPESLTVAE